jgi:hypothetical protein
MVGADQPKFVNRDAVIHIYQVVYLKKYRMNLRPTGIGFAAAPKYNHGFPSSSFI